MARSEVIWVVDDGTNGPIRAFTVKHELGRWLANEGKFIHDRVCVLRMRDGYTFYDEPTSIHTPQEILEWCAVYAKKQADR